MNTTELLLGWKRYEKIRKLSPAAFNRLHIANVTGGGAFDDLIDALPEPTTPVPAPGRAPLTDEQIAVLQFLYGLGNLDGCGFGDRPHGERGMYWWRKHLRAAFPGIAPAGGIGGE